MRKNGFLRTKRIGLMMMLATCLALSGCGQGGAQVPKPCEEIAAAVAETPGLFDELIPQERAEIVAYLGLDNALLTDAALWMDASAATTEMVAVLTAKDADAVKALEGDVSLFLEDMLETYRDYAPDEVPKLKNAIRETRGQQLILIVSKDETAAKASLDAAMKQ